jgi:hypothetical protein
MARLSTGSLQGRFCRVEILQTEKNLSSLKQFEIVPITLTGCYKKFIEVFKMKPYPGSQRPKGTDTTFTGNQSGIATALLVGLVAFILIIVAVVVYAVNNYNVLIAHGITAGMNAVINNSAIPGQEKAEVTRIINQLKEDYLAEEITMEELGLVLEAIGTCPALPIGLVVQFEQSYVVPSGLSAEEKKAAGLHLNRLARGLADGRLDWSVSEEILTPISDPGEDGKRNLRSPSLVTDIEILEVLVTAKEFADEAGISEEHIEIDISDEFRKSVEEALGRSLT